MKGKHETSWAAEEFAEVRLGDKRRIIRNLGFEPYEVQWRSVSTS